MFLSCQKHHKCIKIQYSTKHWKVSFVLSMAFCICWRKSSGLTEFIIFSVFGILMCTIFFWCTVSDELPARSFLRWNHLLGKIILILYSQVFFLTWKIAKVFYESGDMILKENHEKSLIGLSLTQKKFSNTKQSNQIQ